MPSESQGNFGHVTGVHDTAGLFTERALFIETRDSTMASESSTRKDSLKVEKVSLLVLTLCIVVLVYLLVFRPF